MKIIFPLLLVIAIPTALIAQEDAIFLRNPSFEEAPKNSTPPQGWEDCGFPGETPPDVQPNGGFDVSRKAQDGKTYLGMVVRDNETWESVSQPLSEPLLPGSCYKFSIWLCRSGEYRSQSRKTRNVANYIEPVILRIFGGSEFCDRSRFLASSPAVINSEWQRYEFFFQPKEEVRFITIEAFYSLPNYIPYNGNLLVDNLSPIIPIPCTDSLKISSNIIFSPRDAMLRRNEYPEPYDDGTSRGNRYRSVPPSYSDYDRLGIEPHYYPARDLETCVRDLTPTILFKEYSIVFDNLKWIEAEGEFFYGRKSLEALFNAIAEEPEARVIIAVKDNPQDYTKKRVKRLKKIRAENGYYDSLIKIVAYSKVAPELRQWDAENDFLAVKIIWWDQKR